jgi:branched-chain amino acid transport system permease protein
MVLDTCDRIVVLNFGEVIAQGTPAEVAANPVVVEAYLGSDQDTSAAAPEPTTNEDAQEPR